MNLTEIFKELIWDALVQLGLKQLFAAIPWLAWGPLGIFIGFIVTQFSSWLFSNLAEVINLQMIIINKEELAVSYSAAALKLKMVAQEKGIDSEEFKAERENAKASLARLIHFGG